MASALLREGLPSTFALSSARAILIALVRRSVVETAVVLTSVWIQSVIPQTMFYYLSIIIFFSPKVNFWKLIDCLQNV